jgi:hypothetical protein
MPKRPCDGGQTKCSMMLAFTGRWRKWIATASVLLLKVFGETSYWLTARLLWLASNLDAQGRHGEAEALHRRVLAIRAKVFGPEHQYTAVSLASSRIRTSTFKGSTRGRNRCIRRALVIFEKALGAELPETAICLSTPAAVPLITFCSAALPTKSEFSSSAITIDIPLLDPRRR